MPLGRAAEHDLLGRISTVDCVEAFRTIVRALDAGGRFELKPNIAGKKKALHFLTGDRCYFAFVANNRWLLWYFRKPGFTDRVYDWNVLRAAFPDIAGSARSDPEKVEAILRISDRDGAQGVVSFVQDLRLPSAG